MLENLAFRIVDFTSGKRAIWYRKDMPTVIFLDKRESVKPTFVCDSTKTVLVDSFFDLGVFDPPHVNFGKSARMSKDYGHHTTEEIRNLIKGVSKEAHRIIKPNGLLALKWNDHDQTIESIFEMMPDWQPLFGHIVSKRHSTRSNATYWALMLRRHNA